MLGLRAPLPREFTYLVSECWFFTMCVFPQSGLVFLTAWWLGSRKECPKKQEVGAASFLKSGAGNWYRVPFADFYSEAVTDPRFKVRDYRFRQSICGMSKNLGHLVKPSKRSTEYHH